jgi:sulfite reductase (NADPH) flavoprotein alpha-component
MTEQPRPVEIPLIPETAPFSPEQRAWLNGFFAGLFGAGSAPVPAGEVLGTAAAPVAAEDFPWHDPSLSLAERMAASEGRPLPRRLMAAMAQLDCGQCGYLCQSYAEAIAAGGEKSLTRCVPGGRETARKLKELMAAAPAPAAAPVAKPVPAAAPPLRKTAAARLLSREVLNKPGSEKEVRHIALSHAGTGLTYEVGDSLGVMVENCAELVTAIAGRLGPSTPVPCPDGATRPLEQALARHLDIARPSDDAIALFRDRAIDPADRAKLETLLDGSAGEDLAEIDLLDLFTLFPADRITAAELAMRLLPLQPRLYSIASSPKAHAAEVHLTVSAVRWQRRERARKGVGSTFLADRAGVDAPIEVYVQPSHGFRLPKDDAPIIMIGPGTGIAPFRAFLAERAARGATGRNWLFFGDQRRACDFLYQRELEDFLARGTLTRLDLAFSRDQLRKIYVQDRMRENAAELWAWLGAGAYVYVCGDAKRMARDVHRALIDIAAAEGRLPLHEAEQWLGELGRAGRYLRDVY